MLAACRFSIGPTTTSNAERLNLATASLSLPKAKGEDKSLLPPANPEDESKPDIVAREARAAAYVSSSNQRAGVSSTSGALVVGAAALSKTKQGIYEMDYGKLVKNQTRIAYPLTMTIRATVNMKSSYLYDSGVKDRLADFLTYAATSGQVPGDGAGELPDGYTPLTYAQSRETLSMAAAQLTVSNRASSE